MNCDLQFTRENDDFIRWIENLETHTRNILYDNRAKWFDSDLEKNDIENSFVSSLKPYKSAKFYIMRTGIPIKDEEVAIKIYDEEENIVNIENLKENTEVLTIMECKGVRCSSRSFQIEVELKQMMVQESKNPFEKCILTSFIPTAPIKELKVKTVEPVKNETPVVEEIREEKTREEKIENTPESLGKTVNDPIGQNANVENKESELCEVEFNLEEMPEVESVQLKKRNEVYYELYREARRKAKVARDLALSAYLEAKRIKNTYMLDNLKDSDESDNDLDDEFDDDDEPDIDEEEVEDE